MDLEIRQAYRQFQAAPTMENYVIYFRRASRGEQAAHCYFCQKLENFDDITLCSCGVAACEACSLNYVCGDADCDVGGVCPECIDKCPMCTQGICPGNHNTTCEKCGVEFCLDCTKYCDHCGNLFCLDHIHDDDICEECSVADHEEDEYLHNPYEDDPDEDRCTWVELMRRPLHYERCPNFTMTEGLCSRHFRIWQNLERERLRYEDKPDTWNEDIDTRPLR